MSLILFGSAAETPRAPLEIQDAVAAWGLRQQGRRARVEFLPFLSCWAVLIVRKPGDPARRAVQEGAIPFDIPESMRDFLVLSSEHEVVALQEPAGEGEGYRAFRVEDLGADGVVRFLERGDTWSGRGESNALYDPDGPDENERRLDRMVNEAGQGGWDIAHDMRRQALGIPLVPGADFKN